jgi:assimilatory nitrate reductase catalytic subunit
MEIQIQTGRDAKPRIKLTGDKAHPANFGRLCVKGSSAAETIDYEGRMLQPQVFGKLATWDEALDTVARRFQEVIEVDGPDAVAFYVSGQFLTEDYYVANKLMKGFIGSANIDTNSRLCMSSAVAGYKRAFGTDTVPCSYEDLDQADLITIVGSNTAWAHPITYQRIAAAKKARPNLKVVVIDPRRTATCDIADLHLAVKPGMDAVLFNGLLHAVAAEQALDEAFIEASTEGFAQALAAVEEYSAEKVSELSGCSVEDVQQWFEWFAARDKSVTLYSQGVNQSSSGVDKSNAIINCHLATGRIGKPGMGPFSITGQPNAMGGREVGGLANQLAAHLDFNSEKSIELVERFWQAPNMARDNGLKAVDMMQAVAEGRIKAIWIMNTNPVDSMPDADFVRQALKDCPFVVVSDCMQQTDTTEVADVLLPATTWGEDLGTVTNSERTISLQRPFIKAPESARPDWWILAEVAKRMGFVEAFDYQSAADIFREHAQLSGFENEESGILRDFDISYFSQITEEAYQNFEPVQWPVTQVCPQGTPRMFSDGLFFTLNRKARFIAIEPRAPVNQPDESYPVVLNTGRVRDQWHTMTRTAKTPKLMAHIEEPYLEVSAEDAQRYGLQPGGLAQAEGKTGRRYVGRVVVSDHIDQGQAFAPMHWTAQYASEGRVDALVPAVTDPISGQPELKHAVVKLSAFPAQWYGFILICGAFNKDELERLDYWVKIKGDGFNRYEMASLSSPSSFREWAQSLLEYASAGDETSQEWLEYEDVVINGGEMRYERYRCAIIEQDRLQAVMFLSRESELPARQWLGQQFKADVLDAKTRRSLLAGSASGAKDEGRTVCSCFGVGFNTIVDAIVKEGLDSVEAIGNRLKAGTNCGSCIPELTEILQKVKAGQIKELS